MSKVLDQKFELVSVDRLHLADPNPRKGNVPRIAESIKSNGFYKPLIVQRSTGRILVGNHSYIAAINEGLKELPAIWLDCTDAEGDRIMLADNLLSDAAEWDEAALAETIKGILAEGTALPDIGFDAAAYDDLLASIEAANPTPVVEDEAPSIDKTAELQKKWNTARGQVWEIPSLKVKGKSHRLMCGDSTDVADVERLLDDAKPLLMVTDPPYGVSYDPAWRDGISTAPVKRRGKVYNDDRSDWQEAYALFPGDVAYVWHADKFSVEVAASLRASDFSLRSQIIWSKQHLVLSRGDYHYQHEPCWYAVRHGRAGHWNGDRTQTTVWQIANLNSMGGNGNEQTTGHGTQKPIECMRRPIANNSNSGEVVYDPFLGSGTTLVAAEQLGRLCYGLEIDPGYCAVILERTTALGLAPILATEAPSKRSKPKKAA